MKAVLTRRNTVFQHSRHNQRSRFIQEDKYLYHGSFQDPEEKIRAQMEKDTGIHDHKDDYPMNRQRGIGEGFQKIRRHVVSHEGRKRE